MRKRVPLMGNNLHLFHRILSSLPQFNLDKAGVGCMAVGFLDHHPARGEPVDTSPAVNGIARLS